MVKSVPPHAVPATPAPVAAGTSAPTSGVVQAPVAVGDALAQEGVSRMSERVWPAFVSGAVLVFEMSTVPRTVTPTVAFDGKVTPVA
jgi:hypothetical protein